MQWLIDIITGALLKPRVLVVSPEGAPYYQTINAAIAAASALTPSAANPIEILVCPGIYDEPVEMVDYVPIRGFGWHNTQIRSTSKIGGSNLAVLGFANHCRIDDIAIIGSEGAAWGVSINGQNPGQAANKDDVEFHNCYIYGSGDIIRSRIGGTTKDVSNFRMFNCVMRGGFDGIMLAGAAEFYGCDTKITNESDDHRTACVYPDSDLTGKFYGCRFKSTNNATTTAALNDAFAVRDAQSSILDFYSCSLKAISAGNGECDAVTIKNTPGSTINIYGGQISSSGQGAGTEYNIDAGGNVHLYGPDFDKSKTNGNITGGGSTGGAGSAGAGNQYVEVKIGGTRYKVLHDGPL